jgi:hypothetical protein
LTTLGLDRSERAISHGLAITNSLAIGRVAPVGSL